MKITKRELRRLLGEAVLEKGWESWDDWQNPGAYAPGTKPVTRAAAEEEVEFAPSGRVVDPSREEMWGFDEEPDYDEMYVGPVPTSALVKRVVPNEYDLEFAEEFGGGEEDYEEYDEETLYEAKDAAKKTRPDGYTDLPAFMTIGKQSPTKYSGYGAQLGHGVIDDPAVVDPLGDDIDAGALRQVNRLMQRGEDKKKDKKKLKESVMSVTRNDIRRLVNEALDEMSMMGVPGGMRRQRPGMCLYVTYGGGVFYFVAPCPRPGASEEEAAEAEDAAVEMGREVTSELDPEGRGMANAFDLYSWLQDHDEITHVHDFESVGGTVPKKTYMIQVREVGQEEGLFPPDDVVNEGAFPEELEGVYGAAPPEDYEEDMGYGDEDEYSYGDDPDEFLDLSGGEIMRRMYDRGDFDQPYEDDIPPGAADVALRMGRGYRTDEGDFDPDVGYIDDPKSARHGKPMKRRSADDEPLNEARWAKLAGILKG
jgi:hypothetical protein